MNINRHNYEAWFLDYSEGNLSAEQVAELFLFLEQHPELNAELEAFENISLNDETYSFDGKLNLQKVEMSDEQFEENCIADVEGIISADEKEKLLQVTRQQKQKADEYALFQKTRLPEEEFLFDEKGFVLKNQSFVTTNASHRDLMLVAYTEGWLSADEMKQVEQLAANDASLMQDLRAYEKVTLRPSLIVFPDKSSLKKTESGVISLFTRRAAPYFAAAAMIAFMFTFLNREHSTEGVAIEKTIRFKELHEVNNQAIAARENRVKEELSTPQQEEKITPAPYRNRKPNNTVPVRQEQPVRPSEFAHEDMKDSTEQISPLQNNENQIATTTGNPEDSLRQSDKPDESLAQNPASETLTWKEFLQQRFNKKVFGKEKVTRDDVNESIAQKASRITGMDVSYRNAYAEDHKEVQFSMGNFAFSRKSGK